MLCTTALLLTLSCKKETQDNITVSGTSYNYKGKNMACAIYYDQGYLDFGGKSLSDTLSTIISNSDTFIYKSKMTMFLNTNGTGNYDYSVLAIHNRLIGQIQEFKGNFTYNDTRTKDSISFNFNKGLILAPGGFSGLDTFSMQHLNMTYAISHTTGSSNFYTFQNGYSGIYLFE